MINFVGSSLWQEVCLLTKEKDMSEKAPLLLTVKEAGLILRIRRAKVYLLIETGALKGVKVGSDWRIKTNSMEELIGGPLDESYLKPEDTEAA